MNVLMIFFALLDTYLGVLIYQSFIKEPGDGRFKNPGIVFLTVFFVNALLLLLSVLSRIS